MTESCKICTGDEFSHEDPLISPCQCCGSIKWVHKTCLDHWRTYSPANFSKCDICKHSFKLKHIEVTTALYYKQCMRYYMYMTRDITMGLIAWNLICFAIGYYSDKKQWFEYIDILVGNRYVYYWLFGNLVASFITGVISILVILIILIDDGNNHNHDLGRLFDRSRYNSTRTGNSKAVNKTSCCTMCVVMVGIVTICFSAIWLIGYLAKKHSDRTWRKELAKTQIVVPNQSIPDSYVKEYI